MIKSNFYLFFMLLLVINLGCKKDDEEVVVSKEKLIAGESSKSWKITAAEGKVQNMNYSFDFYNNKIYANGQEVPASWLPSQFGDIPTFPECAKDNIVVFKSDKTYETNEGANVCTGEDDFVILSKGTWALSSDEKELTLKDNSGQEMKYVLSEITAQTLKGDSNGSFSLEGTNLQYTLTTTLTAQ